MGPHPEAKKSAVVGATLVLAVTAAQTLGEHGYVTDFDREQLVLVGVLEVLRCAHDVSPSGWVMRGLLPGPSWPRGLRTLSGHGGAL